MKAFKGCGDGLRNCCGGLKNCCGNLKNCCGDCKNCSANCKNCCGGCKNCCGNFKKCCDGCKNCCKCRKTEEPRVVEPEGTVEICGSAFLPECVRNVILERNRQKLESSEEPYCKKYHAIVLTCEIPAIKEVIDFYSVSINFTVDEVAEELNNHLTNIIKCIKVGGGDIMLFEAGILLCTWIAHHENIHHVTQNVVQIATTIQQKFGDVKTSFGKSFRTLIGISSGNVKLYFVGVSKIFYVLIGTAVGEAYYAMSQCGKKEVVVARQVWKNMKETERFRFQTLPDEYVTIFPIEEDIPFEQGTWDDTAKEKVLQDFEAEYGKLLGHYLHPLYDTAKTNQQLQMLSSLTQIVAVVVMIENLDLHQPNDLHNAVEAVYKIVKSRRGIVKNIINFPHVSFYIYFGFPGFKHEDDPVRAVLCSQDIIKDLKCKGLKVNIGISSSTVFCGILGPPVRQVRCVLGMAMCVASKIVNQFPDSEIICCVNTFFLTSRIFGEIFKPVRKPSDSLKTTFASSFYEITSEPQVLHSNWKCIGRTDEKEEILSILQRLKAELPNLNKVLPLVTITGPFGSGKTTFLSWLTSEVQTIGFAFTVIIENETFEEPYDNSWQIVKEVLTMTKNDTDDRILEMFGSDANDYPLYMLNKIFSTTFEPTTQHFGDPEMRKMMIYLIKECLQDKQLLICLPDACYTGIESWLFLQDLLLTKSAVIVASIPEDYTSGVPFVDRIFQDNYAFMKLRPLNEKEIATLACKVLSVQAINNCFFEFLQKHSEGNPLRLQEILMIPPVQKHFCIVPYNSVPQKLLQKKFYQIENKEFDRTTAVVCDVLDSEKLKTMTIPDHLIDVVRDHSIGMSAEEQILVRKCALLGSSFGINVVEAICPEYPVEELRCKIYELVRKNILNLDCDHLEVAEVDRRKMVVHKLIPLEFCPHNIRFSCGFLRNGVLSVIPESQKERLNLYLAELLKVEMKCDTCKWEADIKRNSIYNRFFRAVRLPFIDMRLCRCKNLQTVMYLQLEFHLDKGNASTKERVDVLLKAAASGLKAHLPMLVEKIINKAQKMVYAVTDSTIDLLPNPYKVAIDRLRAELNLLMGKDREALAEIKHALLLLNIMFPADIRNKVKKNYDGQLLSEQKRCLWIGCIILANLGEYSIAAQVGWYQLNLLLKTGYTFSQIVLSQAVLLMVISRNKPYRKRNCHCNSLISQIRHKCFRRLTEYPVLNIDEIKAIIRSFKNVVLVLFEKGQLNAAEALGIKCFQLLKIIKHEKELGRILNLLAYIYIYSGNEVKCFEMIGQFQDALQQSGDVMSEALYYSVLVTILRKTFYRGAQKDKIEMCSIYADRYPTLPLHSKFTDRLFYVCSKMAQWSYEHDRIEMSEKWLSRAASLQPLIRLNNFYAISGAITVMQLDVAKMQKNYVLCSAYQLSQFKKHIRQDLESLDKAVKNYVPVLLVNLDETEALFSFVVNLCNALKT